MAASKACHLLQQKSLTNLRKTENKTMKKKIAEGKALGLKYEIFDNTGIIDHIEFRKDMIYISPTTGRHIRVPELDNYPFHFNHAQSLQLKGEQDSIELPNVDAIGNNGQELTLFLLTRSKRNQGAYFRSVNHQTHQTMTNSNSMRAELYPYTTIWTLFFIAMVAFFFNVHEIQHKQLREAVMTCLVLSPIIMLPLYMAGSGLGFLRSLVVKRNRAFKSYAAALSQKLHTSNPGLI